MTGDVICTTHQYLSTGNPFHTLDVYRLQNDKNSGSSTSESNGGGQVQEEKGKGEGGLWVIFIHGGAWRDENNSKLDGHHILTSLLQRFSSSSSSTTTSAPSTTSPTSRIAGCASLDYRLSVPNAADDNGKGIVPRHPAHIQDVIAALSFLQKNYHFGSNYILIGHSAGATLALQSLVPSLFAYRRDGTAPRKRKRFKLPTILYSHDTNAFLNIKQPKAVVCTEGIYDLHSLVDEYPSYTEFVANAFGRKGDRWTRASPATMLTGGGSWSQRYKGGRIVLVQSEEDELLSMRQTEEFKKILDRGGSSGGGGGGGGGGMKAEIVVLSGGKHDDVWKENAVVDVIAKVLGEISKDIHQKEALLTNTLPTNKKTKRSKL